MSRLHRIAALVLLAQFAGAAVVDAVAEVATRIVAVGEKRRSYLLFLPNSPTALGTGFPLVVALHGGAGTAEQMMRFSRFNELAARERFAVAYPQGEARQWNDGRVFSGSAEADDVAFIRAVVADINAKVAPLDRKRIYATGISNGGFMSFRLACEAADLFTAVAPVTATLSANLGERCRPSAPIAVLVINGTADPLVPYQGGHVRAFVRLRGEIWSTDRTVSFWAGHNRCTPPPDVRALADRDPTDGSRVVDILYRRCQGALVRLLRVEGGGHTWPGGVQYLPESWIGPTNRDIDATETIWRFFKTAAR